MIATAIDYGPEVSQAAWFVERSRAPRLRSMREFAETEIVIPDGPFEGRRFRCDRQPFAGLWFGAVDSGRWCRYIATGPTQTGKTLCCYVIPLLYHLFEMRETVICGLPDMDMAADKWREDILPAIECSQFRELLPKRGGGSRGGKAETIRFGNGATLKFMSGGGGDKSRAGFTARVVLITETDGMDEPGVGSREADKITQLEARTRAYGSRKRIYMECTVSIETGRTWQEYTSGTESKVALPCPHCKDWTFPGRENLVGWQDAETQVDAHDESAFYCPACGEQWSESDRIAANCGGLLVHRGQSIDTDGKVVGEPPKTDTFGFRWSAVNNLFCAAGDIGADEWQAAHAGDHDNAERKMRQFVWALPVEPETWESTHLDAYAIARRVGDCRRGIVPADIAHITVGIDLGKYLCHWAMVAWGAGAGGTIIDYGRLEVASDQLGVEKGIMVALRSFRDELAGGRPGADGDEYVPDQVWIDSGYQADVVYAFVRESSNIYHAAVGRGAGQQRTQWYNRPKTTGAVVKAIGEGYHVSWLKKERLGLLEVNADHWKSWVHQRLSCPADQPGAMTLFAADARDHVSIAKHLTAEREVEEFVAGKGLVTRWERVSRNNHWLDAVYNASAAGHFCGVRLIDDVEPAKPAKPAKVSRGLQMPDGRPFLLTER